MPRSSFSDAYRTSIDLLIDARRSAGRTQTILAFDLGKPQSFVAKYERLERRLDIIEFLAVADALGSDRTTIVSALLERLPEKLPI